MILYIILLIVSIVALALILWCAYKEDAEPSLVWFTIIFTCFAICSFVSLIIENEPTALDVYRDKTTLEITYRDSVAVDSVVVYKVKEKRK